MMFFAFIASSVWSRFPLFLSIRRFIIHNTDSQLFEFHSSGAHIIYKHTYFPAVGVSECRKNVLDLEDGYWRQTPLTKAVVPCPTGSTNCLRGAATGDAACKEGSEGPLCGVCSHGYFLLEGECAVCASASSALNETTVVLIVAILVVVILTLWWVYYDPVGRVESGTGGWLSQALASRYLWLCDQWEFLQTKAKIVISTYQVVTVVPATFAVSLPASITDFLGALSFLSPSFSGLVPSSCFDSSYDYVDRLIVATVGPLIFSAILFFYIERKQRSEHIS